MRTIVALARKCREIIYNAERGGLIIGDGEVIDLLADKISFAPLEALQDALVVAGYAERFPRATKQAIDRLVSHYR